MSRLTKKQKAFADAYLDSGNGTQAAYKAMDVHTDRSAAVTASRTLRRVKVMEYLESKSKDAASMVYTLSQGAENEQVRLGASKDILDRSGLKPVEHSDFTSGGEKIDFGNLKMAKQFDEFLKQQSKGDRAA